MRLLQVASHPVLNNRNFAYDWESGRISLRRPSNTVKIEIVDTGSLVRTLNWPAFPADTPSELYEY